MTLSPVYQAGHNVGRSISLERVIEQSRDSSSDALYRSSQGWHEDRHVLAG